MQLSVTKNKIKSLRPIVRQTQILNFIMFLTKFYLYFISILDLILVVTPLPIIYPLSLLLLQISVLILQVEPYHSMPINQQQRKHLHTLILQEKIQEIDLTNSDAIDMLIEYINQLDLVTESLIIMKTLAQAYGIPIIIYFKLFYLQAQQNAQFVKQNKKCFVKIASITQSWLDNQPLQQLQFIYMFGKPTSPPKLLSKPDPDIQLAKLLLLLSGKNKQLRECPLTTDIRPLIQAYNQYVQQILQNSITAEFDPFMLRCLDIFVMRTEELEQIVLQQSLGGIDSICGGMKDSNSFLDQTMPTELYNFLKDDELGKNEHPHHNEKWDERCVGSVEIKQAVEEKQQYTCFYKIINNQNNQPSPKSTMQVDNPNPNKHKQSESIPKPLCCRRSFYTDQIITNPQNERVSYLFAPYPFKVQKMEIIKSIICSFLNHEGGILYIGFVYENHQWVVHGTELTENQKSSVMKTFRQLCERIEPSILSHSVYTVDFVPLQTKDGEFVAGNWVIKLTVKYGLRDEIYSYEEGGREYFAFREGNEILYGHGRALIRELHYRLTNPLPVPAPLHPQPCQKPHKGLPLNQPDNSSSSSTINLSNSRHSWYTQNQKRRNQHHNRAHSPIKDSLRQQKQKQILQRKKYTETPKQQQNQHSIKSSQKQILWHYFYGIGVTRNQMLPLFQKKSLQQKIQIEQSLDPSITGLIIKVHQGQSVSTVRKICSKLQAKYSSRGVKFHQLSLQLKIDNVNVNSLRLPGITHYKPIDKDKLKFKYYKDSLKAFIELEKKNMKVQFVHEARSENLSSYGTLTNKVMAASIFVF